MSMMLLEQVGWGQTTIASDGLNNSTTLFTLSGGAYYTGTTSTGDAPASAAYAVEGTHSRGIANGTATLTSSNINTSGYSSIQMSFRLASYSVSSTGNGADASDIVTVEVSPDGGVNYYSTIRVLGNTNARWSWSTGTGNASTGYDGNSTPFDFAPAGGGARTTDGYSTVTISSLPSSTNLKIRIRLLNNDANERWLIDDFNVTGTATPTISNSGTLSSVNTTYGSASSSPTSFSISGTNMTAGINVTPPLGFEVSTVSDFSSNVGDNSSAITVGSSGTIASTTVYVRLKASATVSGSPYSGNIVLSSTGATSVNVATASSTVTAKTLTITGLSAADKDYDGTTTVSVTGTPVYSGLANSESFAVTGTVTWAFPDANVGANKILTRTGSYDAPSGNYTVTQLSLTASISAIAPSVPVISFITPGNQQLSVVFTAPSSDGGSAITTYKYSTNGGVNWQTRASGNTGSPLVITTLSTNGTTALTNDITYNIQIRAVNTAGEGTATGSTQGTPTAGTLPVSLLSFSGYKDGIRNQLRWVTSSEINNRGFQVERSSDGQSYQSIGFVNSLAIGGNSQTPLKYSFSDAQPTGVKQYYRLKQTDIDGRNTLSNILLIQGEKPTAFEIASVFPNPTRGQITMLLSAPTNETVNIRVMDLAGRILETRQVNVLTGNNSIPFDLSKQAKGQYLIQVGEKTVRVVSE
jgi:hypothetical protein